MSYGTPGMSQPESVITCLPSADADRERGTTIDYTFEAIIAQGYKIGLYVRFYQLLQTLS
jgi:hypothetical protein